MNFLAFIVIQTKYFFNQAAVAGLSTLSNFSNVDLHSEARKSSEIYNVNTISLNDLIDKYCAPNEIDYLSIDTEGSEYEIFINFDFYRLSFGVIACELNYMPMREKIYNLLKSRGYKRVLENASLFDDWYTKLENPLK